MQAEKWEEEGADKDKEGEEKEEEGADKDKEDEEKKEEGAEKDKEDEESVLERHHGVVGHVCLPIHDVHCVFVPEGV